MLFRSRFLAWGDTHGKLSAGVAVENLHPARADLPERERGRQRSAHVRFGCIGMANDDAVAVGNGIEVSRYQ